MAITTRSRPDTITLTDTVDPGTVQLPHGDISPVVSLGVDLQFQCLPNVFVAGLPQAVNETASSVGEEIDYRRHY